MSETLWTPWDARPAPGNVEAAATIYYRGGNPVGGHPVADIYDPSAVPLIAAAPDLMQCALLADEALSNACDPVQDSNDPLESLRFMLRAAIAKARGETP